MKNRKRVQKNRFLCVCVCVGGEGGLVGFERGGMPKNMASKGGDRQ